MVQHLIDEDKAVRVLAYLGWGREVFALQVRKESRGVWTQILRIIAEKPGKGPWKEELEWVGEMVRGMMAGP